MTEIRVAVARLKTLLIEIPEPTEPADVETVEAARRRVRELAEGTERLHADRGTLAPSHPRRRA